MTMDSLSIHNFNYLLHISTWVLKLQIYTCKIELISLLYLIILDYLSANAGFI